MPLLKLWNTIRGRSNTEAPERSTAELTESTVAAATAVSKPSDAVVAAPTKPAKASVLGIFGSSDPHANLCKKIRGISAKTLLEIQVDDGSRAIAVLQMLAKNQSVCDVDAAGSAPAAIRYIAIDQFEMAGGTTTLKQFHQTLRSAAIRPQVYPEPIDRGLIRVAHTVGAVDLILVSVPVETWQTPTMLGLLKRVSHAGTVVIFRDKDQWLRYENDPANSRRAA